MKKMLFAIAALVVASSNVFAAGGARGLTVDVAAGKVTLSKGMGELLEGGAASRGATVNSIQSTILSYAQTKIKNSKDQKRFDRVIEIANKVEESYSQLPNKSAANKERAAYMIATLVDRMNANDLTADLLNTAVREFNQKFGTNLTVEQLQENGCFPKQSA